MNKEKIILNEESPGSAKELGSEGSKECKKSDSLFEIIEDKNESLQINKSNESPGIKTLTSFEASKRSLNANISPESVHNIKEIKNNEEGNENIEIKEEDKYEIREETNEIIFEEKKIEIMEEKKSNIEVYDESNEGNEQLEENKNYAESSQTNNEEKVIVKTENEMMDKEENDETKQPTVSENIYEIPEGVSSISSPPEEKEILIKNKIIKQSEEASYDEELPEDD